MINVAVIGCGYWGPNLVRCITQTDGARLAGCCDLIEERVRHFKEMYKDLFVTTDYRELISHSGIDALIVSTDAHSHYPITRDALLAGKDVLVEKPLASSSKEAAELIHLAKEKGRVLMVGHTFLYNRAVLKLKELIKRGEIGDIYYTYSTRVNLGRVRRDVNVLWNLAPHDISILLYLFDEVPSHVSSRGCAYLQDGVEDIVFLTMRFPSGVLSQIHVSWLDPNKVRRMTIVGTKKMVVYDDIDNEAKLRIYDKGVAPLEPYDTFGEFHFKLRGGDLYIPKIDLTEPLKDECAHFIECILERKNPLTDGEHGLKVIRVLEAATRSLSLQEDAMVGVR